MFLVPSQVRMGVNSGPLPEEQPKPRVLQQPQTLLPPGPAPRGCPPALPILLARGEAAGGF